MQKPKHLWKPNPWDPFGGFTCAACKDGSLSNKKKHKRRAAQKARKATR